MCVRVPMPDKPTDSLQFFKITTNPPSKLAQRGRGREVLESLREDLKMYPLPFRAMAEIALTATRAKYMPFA